MSKAFKDKVVVLTGGSGGIGRSIGYALGLKGARIALCGGRNKEKLISTQEKIRETGADVFSLPGDLCEDSFLFSCMDRIDKELGRADILINNAGIALNESFEKTTPEQLDLLYKVNVRVPYILCQNALPYLRRSDHAAIINISSVVGHKGYPDQSAYTASKHALLGFSKSLANEVYKEKIRVHTICPGGVYTDMLKEARPDIKGDDAILPEEIAEIVIFLLEFRGNAVIDEISVHREGKVPFN